MGFTAVSGLLNGITCILMGAFVYFKNRSAEVNKSYSLLSLGLAVWSFSYFFWQISNDRQSAMFWVRLLTVGSILIPSFYLNFILSLLKLGDKRKKIFITAFLSSLIFIPFCFNNLLIRDLKPKLGFKFWPDAGTLYLPFLVFFFLCVIYSCYLIIKRFKKLSSVGQNQIKYVFIASVAGFLGGSTNYPLWYNIPIPPIGNFLVSIHVFILAYAIVKYRLMAINVVITRAGIFLAVYTVVLGLPFVLSTSGKNHLVNILGPNWWIGPLVLMAFLGTLGPFVYIYLRKKADAILLKEQLRYQDILKLAAVDMTRIRNLQKLLDFIARTITESVCIRHSAIYYFNPEAKRFEMKAGINPKKNQPAVIDLKNELVVWLEKNKLPLAYEEINDRSGNHPDFVILEKQMRLLNASLALPCILENKLLNIIILGDKLSGNTYTTDDLDNFLILAKETALATENAQLYGKIEEDIKQRTKDLIELQKQLIQAEKLATVGTLAGGVAHEINNPLTAILTNVQMLLRSGELDKESLEMIEEATKRCRTIVQKLMAYAKKPLAETAVFSKINLKTII
ncbi:MAG: hypothetical protein KJ926_00820, partial [Candidatus Omnitrophica bacterium]|nr:hypothetical protein [Candidatus Omnitrophota bacterium]